ncbi:MAG: DUF481 domain-containing protein [Verrucomicrobiota bacterium]
MPTKLALTLSFVFLVHGNASGWNPAPPPADEFDWIQLTSGEWLKGEMKGVLGDEVHFDSDKLGMQQIDTEDIKFMRTNEAVRVGYEVTGTSESDDGDRIDVAEGPVEIKDGEVRERDSGRVITEVSEVVTIATGAESEWDNWAFKISMGANFREGNVSQVEYNTSLGVTRITPTNRFGFNYLGTYSRSDGVDFANNHRADFSYDLYRSSRFFYRPVFGEYFRDPFQNIAHRGLLGAAVGYEVIDDGTNTWEVTAGPAFLHTRYDSVPVGGSNSESSASVVVTSSYEREINSHVDFISLYRGTMSNSDAGGYSHHFSNSLSIELTNDLDFDVSLIWDRISNPAREANGATPKEDDLRLMFLLGLDL